MKNPKPKPKTGTPFTIVAFEILKPILRAAKTKGVKVGGQIMIDHEKCGKFPMVFFAQPNGNYLVWFVEDGMHRLYSLVNEKVNHLLEFPSERQAEFQSKLREIQAEMGE